MAVTILSRDEFLTWTLYLRHWQRHAALNAEHFAFALLLDESSKKPLSRTNMAAGYSAPLYRHFRQISDETNRLALRSKKGYFDSYPYSCLLRWWRSVLVVLQASRCRKKAGRMRTAGACSISNLAFCVAVLKWNRPIFRCDYRSCKV
jgi:hypothetical protein